MKTHKPWPCLLALAVLWGNGLTGGCYREKAPTATHPGIPPEFDSPVVRASLLSTGTTNAPGRQPNCHLDLVLDRAPVQPFIVLGRASAIWTGTNDDAQNGTDDHALEALRRRACEAGAHALFQVRSHYQDHWLPPATAGQSWSFSRTIRATALAVVYVRRDGSLLPPPSEARRVIRVPRRLETPAQPGQPPEEDAVTGLAWGRGITDPWGVPVP